MKKLITKKKVNRKTIVYIILIHILVFSFIFNNGINVTIAKTSEDNQKSDINMITKTIGDNLNFDSFVEDINKSVSEIGIDDVDFYSIASSLIKSNSIDYKSLSLRVLSFFFKEVMGALKASITIVFVIVIMAIISNIELEKNSDVIKIAHLGCFAAIATITVATFVDVIATFKTVITTLTTLMQVISPFLMAILISTGAITSTGIVQPLLLFVASAIGFLVNYVVIPFISISVAINVICSISDNLKLEKMSKLFSSSAIWIVGVILTIFLSILSLETSLTSSVDTLAVKTTQSAVSNFVPVVGKFFSDSFESVVGATKVVGKTGGIIGIIAIVIVSAVPVIKILGVYLIYLILAAIVEPICREENVTKYISSFAHVYKNLLGILIGVIILFVISTGIILNLIGSINA